MIEKEYGVPESQWLDKAVFYRSCWDWAREMLLKRVARAAKVRNICGQGAGWSLE